MDRVGLALIALLLFGVVLVVTAPPDPQYSVSVSAVQDAPEDASLTAFDTLSADEQRLFRAALEDSQRFADPPDIRRGYVAYEGTTYEVSVSAHEGPVLSLLQPWAGGLCVLAGGFAFFGRRLYSSPTGESEV